MDYTVVKQHAIESFESTKERICRLEATISDWPPENVEYYTFLLRHDKVMVEDLNNLLLRIDKNEKRNAHRKSENDCEKVLDAKVEEEVENNLDEGDIICSECGLTDESYGEEYPALCVPCGCGKSHAAWESRIDNQLDIYNNRTEQSLDFNDFCFDIDDETIKIDILKDLPDLYKVYKDHYKYKDDQH